MAPSDPNPAQKTKTNRPPARAPPHRRAARFVGVPPGGSRSEASLRKLCFGHGFNRSLEHTALPSGLEEMCFGVNFNRNLEGTKLPANLQRLSFGRDFNQKLDRVELPANLESLKMGFSFNRELDKVKFPPGLQSLTPALLDAVGPHVAQPGFQRSSGLGATPLSWHHLGLPPALSASDGDNSVSVRLLQAAASKLLSAEELQAGRFPAVSRRGRGPS
ncbi:Putative F-box and FNIP repeat-containing protein L60 [Durusdinium trenchii]|uniref:F-box and FNIP repeat-containing protein L60 n=1 Tax=Durusdinium trenchii TaxID=1381693 RepID=A0ABP0SKS0_9DINO